MQFVRIGADTQADVREVGFAPRGAQSGGGKEGVEQALAVCCWVVGGSPGEDIGGEVAGKVLRRKILFMYSVVLDLPFSNI